MEHSGGGSRLLPENAYRKLEPGETYSPIVPAGSGMAEVSPWSVIMALVMVIIFSAACVYIALRAGSGIEAAIPIAVAAIFFGKIGSRKSSILENVIVQSIGQASGVVAAGAAFVIPALYLNQVKPSWWQIFLACFIGGALGVALIIPLRKYFVKERHGELPFPEATAATEILVSGESSGSGAGKVLLASFGLGAAFDFIVEVVHAWNPAITTKVVLGKAGDWLYNFRLELKVQAIAALFGLGYIIGPKYSAIIFSGSVLGYLVMVPLIYVIGADAGPITFAGNTYTIGTMSAGDIFATFVKPIAIGAIATAGIIGLIRMSRIILKSVSLGFKSIGRKGVVAAAERTQLDLAPSTVLLIQTIATVGMGILFFIVCLTQGYSLGYSALYAGIGMVISFVLCFLFTPVAAEAIAIVGTNPVSGMTLVTVIVSSLVMAVIGLKGQTGIFVTLIIGAAVCTALSVAGALISDFKIGYWIGATPRNQQKWKFLGLAVASLVVAFVIPVMDKGYNFLVEKEIAPTEMVQKVESPAGTPAATQAQAAPAADAAPQVVYVPNEDVLPAPQANMIAAVVKGLMEGGEQPYLLYAIGALLAILITIAGVPTLAFALGMYLPIAINAATLAGGIMAWIVGRSGKTKEERASRANQGTLIASGMMAGAAIFGIVAAVLRLDWTGYAIRYLSIGQTYEIAQNSQKIEYLKGTDAAWFAGMPGQLLGIAMFGVLMLATYLLARWGANMERRGK
ncbi:MAG TPA: OPT/YSL family transporter [Myxococcota bacterium]|nr:OPT/YSL family transporter [Myxococcota bacterium]